MNGRYDSVYLLINKTVCRLDLEECRSHICLLLSGKYCNQRHQKDYQSVSHQFACRRFDPNYNGHYFVQGDNEVVAPSELLSGNGESSSLIPREYLHTPPSDSTSKTTNNNVSSTVLSENELQNILNQLGHGTQSQMQLFKKGAQKWRLEYFEIISRVIEKSACSPSTAPTPRLLCSRCPPAEINQEHTSIDVVYFQNKPFLYSIDNRSSWSETGLFRTRFFEIRLIG